MGSVSFSMFDSRRACSEWRKARWARWQPPTSGHGGSDEPELASAGQGRAQADLAIVHTIMVPKT
jgi:hypothetical protein